MILALLYFLECISVSQIDSSAIWICIIRKSMNKYGWQLNFASTCFVQKPFSRDGKKEWKIVEFNFHLCCQVFMLVLYFFFFFFFEKTCVLYWVSQKLDVIYILKKNKKTHTNLSEDCSRYSRYVFREMSSYDTWV